MCVDTSYAIFCRFYDDLAYIHRSIGPYHDLFFFSSLLSIDESFYFSVAPMCSVLVISLHCCKLFIDMGKWFSNIFTFHIFFCIFKILWLRATLKVSQTYIHRVPIMVSVFQTSLNMGGSSNSTHLLIWANTSGIFARWIAICEPKFQ